MQQYGLWKVYFPKTFFVAFIIGRTPATWSVAHNPRYFSVKNADKKRENIEFSNQNPKQVYHQFFD